MCMRVRAYEPAYVCARVRACVRACVAIMPLVWCSIPTVTIPDSVT